MKKLRILLLLALPAGFLLWLVLRGVIVFDHSAVRRGEGVFWNDALYVSAYGEYHEGRTIAKTKDGWQINIVEEDPSRTFIVMRSFLDQYLLVREDYAIPTAGEITAVFWNGQTHTDAAMCSAINEILPLRENEADFIHETDSIFQLKEGQRMRPLYLGYEGCPVATEYIGYLGQIGGRWCLAVKRSETIDGSKAYACFLIPQTYIPLLEKNFA